MSFFPTIVDSKSITRLMAMSISLQGKTISPPKKHQTIKAVSFNSEEIVVNITSNQDITKIDFDANVLK